MPRTNGHAKRKTPAPAKTSAKAKTPAKAKTSPRAPSPRRASPPPPAPPAPALPEDLPEHATLLPAPPEAPYTHPALLEPDDSGATPPLEPSPLALSPGLAT